ncbi:hypothetical protein BTA51_17700 [Hahella sp. CCB-MM4]|uniref:DUF2938 domain-containing protein n=1 Tax=Hahella sp. (strain CCB-MM4) TaxID=1926491 RepID=UPI000B9AFB91|nr:DUF2938 domain-containing protein [Hahella sp. CCB-MM4]OZG72182.1 hypothetical protein BTA51_17700 [Hahella sp. CCB-MM4]
MTEFSSDFLNVMTYSLLIGIGATAVMDIWGLLLKVCLDIPSLSYGMVGRWIAHIPRGKLIHQGIAKSEAMAGETAIGWIIHYMTGIIFAAALLLIWGLEWAANPTLMPAIMVGVTTVVFPYFVLQPCLGAGIASRLLPEPNIARVKSLTTHLVFGTGLYLSALFFQSMVDLVG